MLAAYNCPSTRHKVLPAQCSYPLFPQGSIFRKAKIKISHSFICDLHLDT
nr:unnamed protein product [Callosobruchus analis]CAI5854743.1 unnamed protein product [Callosobruchus analis]